MESVRLNLPKTPSAGARAGQPWLAQARLPFLPPPLCSPPSPPPDSINSKDAHTEPLGCVQVKPISVNFPTRLSAQITRAPNVPFPGIWFPFPPPTPSLGAPPSHSLKIQKILDQERSPPSKGRNGLPAGKRPPPPRCKCSLRPRLPPRIRLSLHLCVPVPQNQKSTHSDFDLQTLREKERSLRTRLPLPAPSSPPGATNPTKPDQKPSHATTACAKNPKLY